MTLPTRRQSRVSTALFVIFMLAAAVAPFALVAALRASASADDAQHTSKVNAAVAAKGQDFASTAAKASSSSSSFLPGIRTKSHSPFTSRWPTPRFA